MERVLLLVKDATPMTPLPWIVKVTIADKTSPRDARNSPKRFQRFVLADEEDNRVQLTLFGDSIAMFSDRLQMYGTYYISNAAVSSAAPQYRIGANCYQWTLNSKCLVEEVDRVDASISLPNSYYTPLDHLHEYKDSGILIDILVVALCVLPVRSTTRSGPTILQEVIVIDKSLCPVVLTLWGHFVSAEGNELTAIVEQKPVVAGLHVRVSSYNGLAIDSRGSSTFHIQPPTESAISMRAWLHDNIVAVNGLACNPDIISMAKSFGQESVKETTSLAIVKTKLRTKLFNITCHLRLIETKQRLLTKKCSSCSKPTSAEVAAVFTCNFCAKKGVTCVPGLRVDVIASDVSGQLPIALYDRDVAAFFRCDYDALLKSLLQEKSESVLSFDNSDSRLEVNLQLKAYDHLYMGLTTRKYSGTYASAAITNSVSAVFPSTPSPSIDLDLLQCIDDLTPAETQFLDNIRKRVGEKALATSLLKVEHFATTSSLSDTLLSTPGCKEASDACVLSEGLAENTQGVEFVLDNDKSNTPSQSLVSLESPEPIDNANDANISSTSNNISTKRTAPPDFVSQSMKRELFPRPI